MNDGLSRMIKVPKCAGLWYLGSERMGYPMNYERLQYKKELFGRKEETMSRELLEHMEQEFEDQFIYDSMALSGSTLTLEETKAILAEQRKKKSAEKETK